MGTSLFKGSFCSVWSVPRTYQLLNIWVSLLSKGSMWQITNVWLLLLASTEKQTQDIFSHLKQLKSQIKYMKHSFQILDIRQCKKMIPERREANKASHVIAQHTVRSLQATAQGGGSLEVPRSSLGGHTADSLERPKPLELAEQSTGEKRLHTYMCAHIYMHTHVHICIYIHLHVHIHTQLRDLKRAHLDSSSEKWSVYACDETTQAGERTTGKDWKG